ncbi:MAG: transporter substrate-binding domain-containing protein [Lachnospiraceae bacterium]|nr:transporter substrate-binding domain-containing protein [Lachnospiraceae bacterium]
MMKRMIIAMSLCAVMLLTGCSSVPENTVNSIEDLKGKNIGVQLKTTADIYSSDIENATVQRFNKSRDAVEALREGVIDAVMLDDAPANVFVEEFGDIRILEEPYAEEEYGIAVNKNNKELLDKINAALATLKSDGTIEQIESAWLKNGETVSAYEGQNKDSYANGNLIMVTNAEFPPYESKMEDGEIVGIDIDIMKAVCDVLDMKLQVEHTAFDALISSVERETADVAVAAMTITGERLEQVDFSDTYMKAKQVIIVRKDK